MPRLIYPWKRFWYARSTGFVLSDGGYLFDPDGEYGGVLNRDALPFERIAGIPCLVLLGEPGIGKSTALRTWDATLRFDLGAYQTDTSLTENVFRHAEVLAWLEGTHNIVLSFDSLDEGRLAVPNVAKVLLRELSKWGHNLRRLFLRIACRTADWPQSFEDGMVELWGEDMVGVYQLGPLRRNDVTIAAELHGIDTVAFLKEIDHREAVPLAIKP
jgi:hypothetical protein